MPPCTYLCGDVGSVLDVAHSLKAEHCLPVWSSVLAYSQSRGRGQLRRIWISPPGNIYAALRLPFAEPFITGAGALVFGTLLARALARQGTRLLLKWPNDLLRRVPAQADAAQGWGKVAGILLEERAGALIAGIGINMSSAPEPSLSHENMLPACCLFEEKRAVWPEHELLSFWLCLVESLLFCYQHWKKSGKDAWLADAQQHLAWKGRQVLLDDGELHKGKLLSPALNGGVRLLCADGEKVFSSGTLRLSGYEEL